MYCTTIHSVGVGDCFNAVLFGFDSYNDDLEKKLKLSSLIACTYAETMLYDKFKSMVCSILESREEALTLNGRSYTSKT